MPNIDYNIGDPAKSVTLAYLPDTVSTTYASLAATLGSAVCYTQTLVVTSGGMSVSFATLVNNVWTITTSDASFAGSYTIDVLYTLSRYPTITMTQSFTLRMFSIVAPT